MLSKYTSKKISRHVYSGSYSDAPDSFPYFEINEDFMFAYLTIKGFKEARDFDEAKVHIPNLTKAAFELIKQGYEIGYNDDYGVGNIYLQDRSLIFNVNNRFELIKRYYDDVSLESSIESILKVLTNEPSGLESGMLLLATTAFLDVNSCSDEYII